MILNPPSYDELKVFPLRKYRGNMIFREGVFLDEKIQEIIHQYRLSVQSMKKVRGAWQLETEEGKMLLIACTGTNKRLAVENMIKRHLIEKGYEKVDLYREKEDGDFISYDRYGNGYVMKRWFEGEEVELTDVKDQIFAAKNLGLLHKKLCGIWNEDGSVIRLGRSETLIDQLERHNRELKRVYSYILSKNRRSDFETLYLSLYSEYYAQAVEAVERLKESEYMQLLEVALRNGELVHGSYNQHKVLKLEGGDSVATLDFSKSEGGLQLLDLYHFLRKTLEKNNWNYECVTNVIEAYEMEKPVTDSEREILYDLFLYPEKFWKAANYYFNSRKSWVSIRTSQKLEDVRNQAEEKSGFLQKLEQWCILKR